MAKKSQDNSNVAEQETLPQDEVTTQVEAVDANLTPGLPEEQVSNEPQVPFEELSLTDQVEALRQHRIGYFDVPMVQFEDLKYLRSKLQGEYEFTGPQEAFLLMNAYMGIENSFATYQKITKEAQKNKTDLPTIQLSAAAIEAAVMYTGRAKGRGIEAAQRIFRIAMALNGPAKQMRALDDSIKAKEEQLRSEKMGPNPEQPKSEGVPTADENPIVTE